MPWCEDCSKFWNPNSMPTDGSCPTCGKTIAEPAKAPWHFKLLLLGVALYLLYRLVQGIVWVTHHA
jgi:hypothetical protein